MFRQVGLGLGKSLANSVVAPIVKMSKTWKLFQYLKIFRLNQSNLLESLVYI